MLLHKSTILFEVEICEWTAYQELQENGVIPKNKSLRADESEFLGVCRRYSLQDFLRILGA